MSGIGDAKSGYCTSGNSGDNHQLTARTGNPVAVLKAYSRQCGRRGRTDLPGTKRRTCRRCILNHHRLHQMYLCMDKSIQPSKSRYRCFNRFDRKHGKHLGTSLVQGAHPFSDRPSDAYPELSLQEVNPARLHLLQTADPEPVLSVALRCRLSTPVAERVQSGCAYPQAGQWSRSSSRTISP